LCGWRPIIVLVEIERSAAEAPSPIAQRIRQSCALRCAGSVGLIGLILLVGYLRGLGRYAASMGALYIAIYLFAAATVAVLVWRNAVYLLDVHQHPSLDWPEIGPPSAVETQFDREIHAGTDIAVRGERLGYTTSFFYHLIGATCTSATPGWLR
jgi:hypothetical protein